MECDGIQHVSYPIHGLQFHPESILTDHGYDYLKTFLRLAGLQFSLFENDEMLPLLG